MADEKNEMKNPLGIAELIFEDQMAAEVEQKKDTGCMAQRYMERVMARDLTMLSIAQSLAVIARHMAPPESGLRGKM